MRGFVKENVAKGYILMTDEFKAFKGIDLLYDHRIKEWERFILLANATQGKRMTYKTLKRG